MQSLVTFLTLDLATTAAVALLAGLMRGFVGFGSGMLMAPAAASRTRTSPAPGSGTGRLVGVSASGPPGARISIAVMVAGIASRIGCPPW